jgi:hypothetical protein
MLGSKRALAAVVAGATLLGGTGAALAHGPGLPGLGLGGGDGQTALLNQVATNLGVSNAKLRSAIKDALKAQVDQAQKDGAITAAQATAQKQRIDAGTVHVGVGGPAVGVDVLGAAADYLGVTVASLRTSLAGGKSLADVAQDKGKTAAGLQDAIVAKATTALAAAVAAGDLTDAQRDTALTRLKANVDDIVTDTHVRGGPPPAGPMGAGMGMRMHR